MKLLSAPRSHSSAWRLWLQREYRSGNLSAFIGRRHSSGNNPRSLHSHCSALAETARDIRHRRSWFFPAAQFSDRNTEGLQLADQLGSRPRVVTATGAVITEPKIAPSGFATFLLKLNQSNWKAGNNPRTRSGRSVGKARRIRRRTRAFWNCRADTAARNPANSICVLISRAAMFVGCSSFAIRKMAH